MSKIIEVRNLRKNYGDLEAVKNLSFYVETGKLFSFLGPNGAGKSTTIDILCTLLASDSGEVIIDGKELGREDDKIRKEIGVVFQDNMLDPLLTVRENLSLRAGFYMSGKEKIHQAVRNAAGITELVEFLDRPYGKLSGGQRRRADIARALIHTPKILFLDEPTTGLDPQTRKSIWDTILKLKEEERMTIFLTTHYMEEAAGSDYIIVIDKGEIAAKGSPSELKEQYAKDLLRLFCSREEEVREILDQLHLGYVKMADQLEIRIPSTISALPILEKCRDSITGFEVVRGTMDDAFIGITGKELRE
ncbi:ABC transporter ATP-binding protein [Sinanaerobacter chloroacetimidivorans]|jgi:multidrug/hemolysin transport system ATP-binding protein|uniref:ABC transporter ATP-binding protein n=1 Tax=Sinanaerobacter chloroacetimidivorans TaxID=2818044 RepID=A0A8J7W7A1_9FIRM|nr:ABC transporter ATP-binding protein [Sinanaerobacter chloroacetimidivorans]MBR0600363.1 ABC transporter ATP-binding protein [Sinanaerobacter chloroacetimidivorans]